MGQAYSTGPCGCWVAPAGSDLFLGHSENGFRINIRPAFIPVHCDVAAAVPYDQAFGGEEAFITGTLTRLNYPVLEALTSRSDPTGGTPGVNRNFDRGGLMLTESLAMPVKLRYPFQALDAYTTLRRGWRFPRCWLYGPDEHEPGAKALKVHVVFYALGFFEPKTESFVLYDQVGLDGLKID